MIARYTLPEMEKIWCDRSKYQYWLRVELEVCRALAQRGSIPRNAWRSLERQCEELLKQGGVDPARVDALEAVTRHDVIAFTTAVAERIGPESRYIHFGLTSSDVVDTALSLATTDAAKLIDSSCLSLIGALMKAAERYQSLPTIGRSHGIYAEPTSFGLKFLGSAVEFGRGLLRFRQVSAEMAFGKLSGAVGVSAHEGPEFEAKVLARLGLQREWVSTQVVPRDRHAAWLGAVALLGAAIERLAIELRHLQRTEVAEVREGFAKGQKGSSAMPHKRNPISSENLTGIARMLRGYADISLENIALWHERDISHSSVERVVFPDASSLLHYALTRMTKVIENLEVDERRVRLRVEEAGSLPFSGHFLLALVSRGVSREEAYQWVQRNALRSLDEKLNFVSLIEKDQDVRKFLTSSDIRRLGSLEFQLRNVRQIFKEAREYLRDSLYVRKGRVQKVASRARVHKKGNRSGAK
jgi:adenylosuccinate lyase